MRAAALLSIVLAAAAGPEAFAVERQPARPGQAPERAARVIVALKPEAAMLRARALAADAAPRAVADEAARRAGLLGARHGLALAAGRLLDDRVQVVRASGLTSDALAERLAADPEVAYAVPDRRRRLARVPNDPLFLRGAANGRGPEVGQWALRRPDAVLRSAIDAEAAWDLVSGSPSVVVAVLDTGILPEHPDLAGRVLAGYDMIDDAAIANDGNGRDADPRDPGDWITAAEDAERGGEFEDCGVADSSWHGTQVATIIGAAADDGVGMAGIAGTGAGVRILPLRVLGKCGGFDSDIVAGMRWAAGLAVPGVPSNPNPARVLNLSLGAGGACTVVYRDAVDAVSAAGALVVAAAGNSAGQAVSAPANCPGVLAVAGLRHAGTKVGFSDLGSEIAISAPGGNCVNIGSTEPCLYPIVAGRNSGARAPLAGGSTWSDGIDYSVGTSFAAPMVAGTAALMLSARPQLTPAEIRRALQATARPFPTSGADNGEDPTPVQTCAPPSDVFEQLQCYCTSTLCGAGMLDAGGAVAAAGGLFARIGVLTASPLTGQPLELSAAGTLLAAGRTLTAVQWTLVDGGGIVAGFSSATNAVTATLLPSAAGSVLVRVTVSDDAGASASTEARLTVPGAAGGGDNGGSGDGGGGGASSAGWLLLLALAVVALRRAPAERIISRGRRRA